MTEPDWHTACPNAATCVEICHTDSGHTLVRNSADHGTYLAFTADEWATFTAGVKAGAFDRADDAEPATQPADNPAARLAAWLETVAGGVLTPDRIADDLRAVLQQLADAASLAAADELTRMDQAMETETALRAEVNRLTQELADAAERLEWLGYLEAAGIDNSPAYDYACELRREARAATPTEGADR